MAKAKGRRRKKEVAQQVSLFGVKSAVDEELEKLDINSLTPLEALNKLYELQRKAKEG
jgi:DNA mismatch repair protein MutS